jgi:hypothetical protein
MLSNPPSVSNFCKIPRANDNNRVLRTLFTVFPPNPFTDLEWEQETETLFLVSIRVNGR